MYGHPIYFLETFVDPERFRGTCYRAANWVLLGRTTGRGKDDPDSIGRTVRSKRCWAIHCTRRFRAVTAGGDVKDAAQRASRESTSPPRSWRHCWSRPGQRLREDGYQKLKAAIRTLGYVTELLEKQETTLATLRELLCPASTEKTEEVLKQAGIETGEKKRKAPKQQRTKECAIPGHGRNGAAAYRGAQQGQGSARVVTGGRSVSGRGVRRQGLSAARSGRAGAGQGTGADRGDGV